MMSPVKSGQTRVSAPDVRRLLSMNRYDVEKHGAVPSDCPISSHTLRILCLHDSESNASELKNEFHELGNQLFKNHSIDLVYVNGPLNVSAYESSSSHNLCYNKEKFVWWEAGTECIAADAMSNEPIQDENQKCRGLDASLMLLRQIWTSSPFWGIIGVGQGASIASLFIMLLESDMFSYRAQLSNGTIAQTDSETDTMSQILPPPIFPQLIIFISGEAIVSVDEPLLVRVETSNPSEIPYILHMVDDNVTPGQTLLTRQFPNGCSVERRQKPTGSHVHLSHRRQSFGAHDLNMIGRFICQRKKALYSIDAKHPLRSDDSSGASQREVLALQIALYNAEQDAVNFIADSIASNPPASLMAVVRSQTFAGWSGNRRLQPEGGGAPCPKEFQQRGRECNHPTPPSTSQDDMF
jgi:hypothetical protein